MSGKSHNPDQSYSEQLSDLENRLHSDAGDEAMLAEMHVAIRTLLSSNGESAEHIQEILQKRFNEGHLREESYELVKNMLDRIVAEETASLFATDDMIALVPKGDPANAGESLSDTDVLEPSALRDDTADLNILDPEGSTAITEDSFGDTAVLETTALHEDSADERLQVGSVLRDRFLLQERISGGSMGVVYKALDRRLAEVDERNPYVAIKVLSSRLSRNGNALRALQQEAAKGRFLSHRNIVRFIDLDRDDDLYFIVMEWLEGRTLADILDDNLVEKMQLGMALDIVKQVARALDYAHRRGVVHADIKPGNIIVTPNGMVKLFDFGVARVRQSENEGKSKFDPGVMEASTPAYSSMQVLTGEVPVPADDVFSLGCLMYRLVADHRVFGPRNAADAAAEGMEPQQPQGLSQVQWRALKKALSYSRVTRFESPGDFIKALEPSAKQEQSVDETMVTDYDDVPKRSRWKIALAGAIVIVSIAVIMQPNLPGFIKKLTAADPAPVVTAEPGSHVALADDEPNSGQAEIEPMPVEPAIESLPAEAEAEAPIVAAETAVQAEEGSVANEIDDTGYEEPAVADVAPSGSVSPPAPTVPVIDFSTLPPATLTVLLASNGEPDSLVLREGTAPAMVDLVRTDGSTESRTVVLAGTGINGSGVGRYALENDGVVTFAAGQDRARIQIAMRSDQTREPDSRVTLQIQDGRDVLGVIRLTLEDDDQRAFDARVPANTVAFTESQIFASESDSAVQINAVRYKPDNTAVEVAYLVRDMTATEGADYFAPALTIIYFGPGQDTARVLIPLTQDTERETDEVFMLELLTDTPLSDPDIFQRIAVMIRDDDSRDSAR